jgi:outer membrane protein assembly factor BamB
MKPARTILGFAFATCVTLSQFSSTSFGDDDWKQFRGDGGTSVAEAKLPKEFDDNKNVAWKTDLPGKGASGPIVVGDRVFLTCSGGIGESTLYTVCVDAESGKKLWTQKFLATGRCFVHPLSANAAPTPASDGERIFAFYSSNDMACMDLDGNLLWYRGLAYDRPKAGNDVGMSSSPVVADGVVVAQVENQGDSFAIGMDVKTGKTIWSVDRPKTAIWASPLLIKNRDKNFLVLQSTKSVDLLDLKTGKLLDSKAGSVSSISSSAIVANMLFAPLDGTSAFAVSNDGKLVQEWNNPKLRPASMSTILNGERLLTLNRAGALLMYNRADGTEAGKGRAIKGSNWATPVVADNHMYCFTQNGAAFVVKLPEDEDGKPEVVHQHEFEGEVFLGSPAISKDALYFRSDRHLWKVAAP